MPATIFSGQKIKTLKDTLTLNGKSDIISSTVDPTASAVDAPIGSLLINQTSGKLYRKLDSGSSVNWEEVGSGVGGINYILNPSAEVNTTGWATYADAAGTEPVDGTGGSPNVTWTRSTTSPLRGVADFNLVKDAANRQGEGVSYDLTIDEADKAKVLTVSFDYEVLSGTYADGDLTVYLIADPAGTPVVIQPAGYTVLSATVGTTMRQIATFQTQATGTSYRLCFHVASTSASAYTLAVDNVVVGPQIVQYGAPVTDPKTTTFTIKGSTSDPTITTTSIDGNRLTYWRVGKYLHLQGDLSVTAGAAGSGIYYIVLPDGLTIDTDYLNASPSEVARPNAGSASLRLGTTGYWGYISPYNSTGLKLLVGNDTTATSFFSSTLGGFSVATRLGFDARVPIQGWSSTVQMSNDTDTRVVAMAVSTATASGTVDGATPINFGTPQLDTHGSYSANTYTVPVSGIYRIRSAVRLAGTSAVNNYSQLSVRVNGSNVHDEIYRHQAATTTTHQLTVQYVALLNSGDTISINASSTMTSPTITSNGSFSVERLSGPSTIAASETVALQRFSTSGQIINSGVLSIVDFPTDTPTAGVKIDTHGSWRAASGVYSAATGTWSVQNPGFVAPVSGIYQVSGSVGWVSTTFTTSAASCSIAVNGISVFSSNDFVNNAASNNIKVAAYSGIVKLNAGDIVQVYAFQNTGLAKTLQIYTTDRTVFNIVKVGN